MKHTPSFMRYMLKIWKYEIFNLLRSKWLLAFGFFLALTTEILLRFGRDPAKVIVSLMNVILIVLPLMSLIIGLTYFYHAREFIELLLSQPIRRGSIFLGKLLGLASSVSLLFIVALCLPFLFHLGSMKGYAGGVLVLLVTGIMFILIFTSVAFLIGVCWEDKIKGLGAVILFWMFCAVVYDAGILLLIRMLKDYPLETPLICAILINPIDLGRILILLKLDTAALMGYTGALFQKFFGTYLGMLLALFSMTLWVAIPVFLSTRLFGKKDF